MAAVLELGPSRKVAQLLKIPFGVSTLWTHSQDVVYWIQGQSREVLDFRAKQNLRETSKMDSGVKLQLALLCR